MVAKYEPTDTEQELYDRVDGYLKRDIIHAINPIALPMLSLIIRKILSSSAYALSFTLGKLISKLEKYKREGKIIDDIDDIYKDIDIMNNDGFSDEEEMKEPTSEYVDYSIDGEIKELLECQRLAQNIKEETKAIKLVEALDVAFNRIKAIGGNRKALIFTESRCTQEYLKTILKRMDIKIRLFVSME